MIENIKSPADVKALSENECKALSGEIREMIIKTVADNGGHLASNVGTVELTLAMHRVFDCPKDKIIFDVGHQCYAHKIITGRAEDFHTLRQYEGISGFTNREESKYDTVTAGHSGPSLSVALGIAQASALSGDDCYTVAVVGDGSFTNGMIYEALNNCSVGKLRLVIILNDNGMSISENVGGLSNYFSKIRTSKGYFGFKCFMKKYVGKIPLLGKPVIKLSRKIKNTFKRLLVKHNIFESLGLEYLGPVDGNDLHKVTSVLTEAKNRQSCTVVHVITKKGLGYEPAEQNPGKYHSTAPFDMVTGGCNGTKESFTTVVSETLCEIAEEDENVCAVSAAMADGCGLEAFASRCPDRFFDVGIAEEHAVSFCGGLSLGGKHPVCVLYSTFAQRVYDQLFHDIALQKLPCTLLLSHAGFVPGDGITHQGIFDVSLFSSIPNVKIYSPDSYSALSSLMRKSVKSDSVDIIRYPKGRESSYDRGSFLPFGDISAKISDDNRAVIVTYGRMTSLAVAAAEKLGNKVGVIRAERIFPLPTDDVLAALGNVRRIYFLEEGIKSGGFCEKLLADLSCRGLELKVKIHAIDGEFVPHGGIAELFDRFGFTSDEIAKQIAEELLIL